MAKSKGWSGSPCHSETYGDGSHMGGGKGSAPSDPGPKTGPGPMVDRVKMNVQRTAAFGNGAPADKPVKKNVGL